MSSIKFLKLRKLIQLCQTIHNIRCSQGITKRIYVFYIQMRNSSTLSLSSHKDQGKISQRTNHVKCKLIEVPTNQQKHNY